jgi:NADP-dependent 3-hydroxy acid dehydrogenase YdfG
MITTPELKVIALTGVTGGMGEAMMMHLLAAGAEVACIGRNPALLQQVQDRANAAGFEGRSSYHIADLADEAQTRTAAADILTCYGGIDAFIHSAGWMEEAKWEDITVEQMERLYRVNTLSPFILLQAFAGALVEREGQVVIINSSSVQTVRAEKTPYTVSKTALKALADSFRAEFNAKGVRTLSVYPGRTGTDMQRRLHEGRGEPFIPETFIQASDVASTVLHLLQLPRTVEVTEIFMRPMRNWMKPGAGL